MLKNTNYIFEFARKFQGKSLALRILEFLVERNGEYRGSYSDLAFELAGDKELRSNIRRAVMWLVENGFVYAKTLSKTQGTYFCVDEDLMNDVFNNGKL